jgi:hypothetical protein
MRSLSGRVVRASNPVIMWRKMAQQVLQRNHVGTKTSRDQYEQALSKTTLSSLWSSLGYPDGRCIFVLQVRLS